MLAEDVRTLKWEKRIQFWRHSNDMSIFGIFPLYLLSLTQVWSWRLRCMPLPAWSLLQNRKTWRLGNLPLLYWETKVNLFLRKRGALSSRVLLQMEPWEIVWIQSCEGLSFLAYSARIYKDAWAHGGLTS